jgi:protein-S-isoprenylcysteine O-methyltransferase Ste14
MSQKPILPPRYFMIALIASLVLHFVVPVVSIVSFPFNLVGLLPIVFGGVINIWADQLFKKRNTTVKPFERPSVILLEGPFAWSRHPMYLGMVAILLGTSLLCGSLTGFLGPIGFWLIIRLRFIHAEEQSMIETFGDDYNRYKRRVRSWI